MARTPRIVVRDPRSFADVWNVADRLSADRQIRSSRMPVVSI